MDTFDVQGARAAGHSESDIANQLAEMHGYDIAGARAAGHDDSSIIQELQPTADIPPNPAMTAAAGALLGGAGKAGQAALSGTANLFSKTPAVSPDEARGVQAWLNSQLYLHGNAPKNVNIPLHEFEKVPGLPGKISDTKLAQQVVEAIRPTPASRVPVTRTINGVPTVIRHETIPAAPGVDIAHLIEKYTPEELTGMRAALAKAGQTVSNATPNFVKSAMASPIAGKIARTVAPAVTLGGVGYDVQDALNRWNKGQYGRAITSGVGAAANAAATFPYQPPVARAVEMGVGMAAPLATSAADYLIGDQGKATGGPVHLADGGQPKKSLARQFIQEQQDKLKAQAQQPWNPAQEWNQNVQSMVTAPANVIKGAVKLVTDPKQWVKDLPTPTPEQMAMSFNPGGVGMAGIIKPKGGQWLSDPKHTLEFMKEDFVNNQVNDLQRVIDNHLDKINNSPDIKERELHALLLRDNAPILEAAKQRKATGDWSRRNLSNYVKNEMGTSTDPVRALHEQGISHLPESVLERESRSTPAFVKSIREKQGFPAEGVATHPHAKAWENLVDQQIRPDTAGVLKNMNEGADKPWLGKLDSNTPVYDLEGSAPTSLGFDHVMDVLQEDMAAGRLRPEQLNKVSVPDAVKRTHEYNQELAKKMEDAKAKRVEGMTVHKEYRNGMKWVQLDQPGQFATESDAMGHSVRGYEPPKGHPDWIQESGDSGSPYYGHGGWEAIKSGKAKVYSLVDPKGNPHTTIEVAQSNPTEEHLHKQPREVQDEFNRRFENWIYNIDYRPSPEEKLSHAQYLFDDLNIPQNLDITQIKGKQNSAPKEQYLPYVQDFVKSGKWGDVDDLHNTGLNKVGDQYLTTEELKPKVDEAKTFLDTHPAFETHRQADSNPNQLLHPDVPYALNEMKAVLNNPEEYDPDTLPNALNNVEKLRGIYGDVPTAPTEQKMLQGVYRGYAGAGGDGSDTLFATPQKRVADYYAEKRAGQTGEAPHVDMLMIDPFAGKTYGHSTMGTGGQEPMFTQAKKLTPEDVQNQTQLYKEGGEVSISKIKAQMMAEGGLLDTVKQNVHGMIDPILAIPGNMQRFANDPMQYLKDLPAPTPEQMAGAFAPGDIGGMMGAIKSPAVNRLSMSYKDVTKRVPELTEAAKKVQSGELPVSKYDKVVNTYKPIEPYSFVPQPSSHEEAISALHENKRPNYGAADYWAPGTPVGLRLDIPAYQDHGVWVNSIHGPEGQMAYGNVSSVKNATFKGSDTASLKIAAGDKNKSSFARINGEWNPMSPEEATAKAQEYLTHPDWRQVGFDPERHGYFYDRHTTEPVTHAEEVLQIGPLVLAKKPTYASKKDFSFAQGGLASITS